MRTRLQPPAPMFASAAARVVRMSGGTACCCSWGAWEYEFGVCTMHQAAHTYLVSDHIAPDQGNILSRCDRKQRRHHVTNVAGD
jgi:hypothetical protein